MCFTLPDLMLYKHVFYLNGLSKEFGKLLAFAFMESVCMYGMYNLVLGKRKRKQPSVVLIKEKGRERKGKERVKYNPFFFTFFTFFTFSLFLFLPLGLICLYYNYRKASKRKKKGYLVSSRCSFFFSFFLFFRGGRIR